MRIIGCAGGTFGLPALTQLIAQGHEVPLLVTPPPRAAGRGRKEKPCAAAAWAAAHDIPVLAVDLVNTDEVVAALRCREPELLFVADFGQIMDGRVLAIPRVASLNLHGSLLPALRGAEPVRRAILAGMTETGVTVIVMDEGIDTGAILGRRACPIHADDDYRSLKQRLADLGAALLLEVVDQLQSGTAKPLNQDDRAATPAPKLTKADRDIDWSRSAAELARLIRALAPAPGAYTWRQGKRLLIRHGVLAPGTAAGAPGEITGLSPLTVATGSGGLVIETVQPEGRKQMDSEAYLRGYAVKVGERWGKH